MSTLLQQLRGIAVDCAVDAHRKDGEWAQVFETVTKLEALVSGDEEIGTYCREGDWIEDATAAELRSILASTVEVRT